jgi:hypothetical protein
MLEIGQPLASNNTPMRHVVGAAERHRAHRRDHSLVQPGTSTDRSAGLQIRDTQPPCGPPRVDQLLGCEARTYSQVSKVPLDGARSNAHQLGRIVDRSTSGDECRERVNLAPSRVPRERAAQVPVPHASRLAAASHSSRPSIGMR